MGPSPRLRRSSLPVSFQRSLWLRIWVRAGALLVLLGALAPLRAQAPGTTTQGVSFTFGDFDGDGKADLAVWRPSAGGWFTVSSQTGLQLPLQFLGLSGDIPVPGDYDGDGKTDIAVWRPSAGGWFINSSKTGSTLPIQYLGLPGDIPVPGDYDGDGMTDLAVWRPSTGAWFVIPSKTGTPLPPQYLGLPGDIPVPADYDGDGIADFAVWRPSVGGWFINSSKTGTPLPTQYLGLPGDTPVPGDYDGDGMADLAVLRPSAGGWFINSSKTGTQMPTQYFGLPGDIPVPADYDGDGTTDLGVWRPSVGGWFIISSETGTPLPTQYLGAPGDIPIEKPIGQFTKPIANAGPDQTGIFVGSMTTLDGTASYNPDGDPISSYSWTLVSVPAGSTAVLAGANTATPTLVPDRPGPYVAQLIVSDGVQTSDPATVTITAVVPGIITVTITGSNLLTYSYTSGNVHISAPAGPSGQVVNLSSNDATIATVPSFVTVPAGLQDIAFIATTNSNGGGATITGFANGFVNGTASISSTARGMTLHLSSALVGLGRTISGTFSLNDDAPACPDPVNDPNNPASITVALASTKPTVAAITPTTITIPCGTAQAATSNPVQVSGIVADTSGFTANATGFNQATASVTVTQTTLNLASVVIAPGQTLALPVSLSQTAATDTLVTLSTANAGLASMVTSTVTIPAGATTPASPAQITGVALGTTTVTGTAPGFAPDTRGVNVTLTLTFSPTSQSVLSFNTADLLLNLSAPAASGGFTANLSIDDTSKATVPATVFFPAGATSETVTVTGVAPGTTTLRARATNVTEGDATITVNPAPTISLNGATTVGKNLQIAMSGTLAVAAPAGNLIVLLSTSDPAEVSLAPDAVSAGAPSITVQVGAGSTSIPTFYVHGENSTGSATITAKAVGYANGTAGVTLAPSGFIVSSGCLGCQTLNTTTFTSAYNVSLFSAVLNPSTLAFVTTQPLSPEAAPVSVHVTSGTTNTGTITTSPVVFATNQSSESTGFLPVNVGTSVISIDTPSGFSTPSQYQSVAATVTGPPISLSSPTVGFDLETSVSVSLGAPAPAGNETITITSSDETKAILSTDPTQVGGKSVTITVNAGSSSSSTPVYVQALSASGPVSLTATATGYTTQTSAVTLQPSGFVVFSQCVGCGNFTTQTFATPSSLVGVVTAYLNPLTLQYVSSQPLAPGVGPVTVTLNDSTPNTGTTSVASVTFNTNQSSQAFSFQPVNAGTTTISVATPATPAGFSTPSNFQSFVVTVTAPNITLSNITLGNNLQTTVSVSLATPAPAGNETITITSNDASKLLLSTSPTVLGTNTGGTSSVSVLVFAGSSSSSTQVYAQAISTGSVTLTATATGYNTQNATATLDPSGFVVFSQCVGCGNFTTTTFSGDQNLAGVFAAYLDPIALTYRGALPLRPGIGPIDVPVNDDTPGTGTTSITSATFNTNQTSQAFSFKPLNPGTANISVTQPAGFNTPANFQSFTVTVTAPPITLNNVTVGNNLQTTVSVSLGTASPTATSITLTSGDSSKVLLSTSPTAVGGPSVTIPISQNASSSATPVYAQALAGAGVVTLTASSAGYNSQNSTVTLQPSGFVVFSQCVGCGNFSTTTFSPASGLAGIYVAYLNPNTLNYQGAQPLRPGLGTVTVTLNDDTPNTGTISLSSVNFAANQTSQPFSFDPANAGTATISLPQPPPSGFTTPSNFQSFVVTVTAPNMSLSNVTVGNNLETTVSASLAVGAPTATSITVSTGGNPLVLLSTDPSVVGGPSVSVPVAANGSSSSTPVYVQALAGSGTVTLTASSPGYNSQTSTVTLAPSGFVVFSQCVGCTNFSTTTFSAATNLAGIYAAYLNPMTLNYQGAQPLRPGAGPVTVNLTDGNPNTGTISLSSVTFGTDQQSQPFSFQPVNAGTTTISITAPGGYSTPSNFQSFVVTVTAPNISLNNVTVGRMMQTNGSAGLAIGDPNPVSVTISVSDPTMALLSTTEGALGPPSGSLTFNLNAGATGIPTFHVQAISPVTGTVQLTATALGYNSAQATITINPSGFAFSGLPSSFNTTTTSSDTTLTIVPVMLNPGTLNVISTQELLPGLSNTMVPVTSMNTLAGTITVSPVIFNGDDSPNSKTTSFHPVAVGTAVIEVGAPAGFSQASNNNDITANVTQ